MYDIIIIGAGPAGLSAAIYESGKTCACLRKEKLWRTDCQYT